MVTAAGKPTVAYKMPREGERIPRSKGVYVEFHIDNHREGKAPIRSTRVQHAHTPAQAS